MSRLKIVELPYFGFSIVKNPWSFGLEGLLSKEYDVKAYVSNERQAKSIKEVLSNEGNKDITYTLLSGVGGTGGAGVGVLAASGITCPACFPVAASLAPFAAVPVVLTGGVVVGKRYGERKALQKLSKSFNPNNAKIVDYSRIENLINNFDLLQTAKEYDQLLKEAKWWQERKSKKNKKKELKNKLNNLADRILELPNSSKEEKIIYLHVAMGYRDYLKSLKKNVFIKPAYYPPVDKTKILILGSITAGGLWAGGYFMAKYIFGALFGG